MPQDGWKHDEDVWEDGGDAEEKELPREKKCPRCLNRMPREAPGCPWCGHRFD